MAVDTMDKLVAGLANSQQFNIFIPSVTNAVAGGLIYNVQLEEHYTMIVK